MKYKATQKLLEAIANGEFENTGVRETVYYAPIFECLIDINKDWTLHVRVDKDAIKKNPDYFEEIK